MTGDKIAACSVSTTKLADGAVANIGADAEGANQLQDGIHINMQDQQLTRLGRRTGQRRVLGQERQRQEFKDFSETSTTPVVTSGSLTLDLESGNVLEVTLTEDVAC